MKMVSVQNLEPLKALPVTWWLHLHIELGPGRGKLWLAWSLQSPESGGLG